MIDGDGTSRGCEEEGGGGGCDGRRGYTYFVSAEEKVQLSWFCVHRETTYEQCSNLQQNKTKQL